jgi:hypothetical protein
MAFCPECGSKIMQAKEKFCPDCGTPLSGTRQAPSSAKVSKPSAPQKQAAKAVPSIIKPWHFGLAAVIILAILMNFGLSSSIASTTASKNAQLQPQMQDTARKYSEDLQRGQVQADAAEKKQFSNVVNQFLQAFNYNDHQINVTGDDYKPGEKITDSNVARKAADAKQVAGLVNNYFSMSDGLKAFVIQNGGELERLDNSSNISSMMAKLDTMSEGYKFIEEYAIADLQSYGNKSASKSVKVAEAIRALQLSMESG